MRFRPIIVDQRLQELTEHGTEEFPMSLDEQLVSHEQCGLIMHWHYEIQLVLVTVGSVLFRTPAGEFLLHKGDGLFLNSTCLHEAVPTEDANSIYISVNFHPRMLFSYMGSILRRDYIDPLLHCAQLQAIPLYNEPWHRGICELMREIVRVNGAQEYGYEISLKILLNRICLIILVNNRQHIEEGTRLTFSDKQRIRMLQQFIHHNYMDRISLADIAGAAHISRGECCRVFKRALQTTPFLYLVRYRIAQSVKLLSTSSLAVTEVAQRTGFGSSSYYTECFKREMCCTPLEYRRQLRRSTEGPRKRSS